MLQSLITIFLVALVAPWLGRLRELRANWALGAVPFAIGAFFLTHLGQIHDGTALSVSMPWVSSLDITFSLYLDGLSLLFSLLITGIGAVVVVYAGGYFAGNPRLGLFYGYLFFFMGSMLGLVLADNLFTLFLFWELTSISSYLLIGFDHEKTRSRTAALQALLVTSAGGLALLTGMLLLGMAGGTFEISSLHSRGEDVRQHELYVPMLLLILGGAFTKSAQFPFHFWLPNAMEAPTPVSAYLHSATMVKAGVYLIARMNPILGGTGLWYYLITAVGAVTTLLGAYLAFRATDLKRILAYSTISVLGTLTMLLGLGTDIAIKAAMVVLLAHALYKGALFLVAGAVDHAAHRRDIRQLGGLRKAMPITMMAACLAGLSMAGVAPTFGFIGKELYYEAVGHASPMWHQFAAVASNVLLVVVAGMVCVKPFFGRHTESNKDVREVPVSLWAGPLLMATLGIVLAVLPQATAQPLIAASCASITGEAVTLELMLWHGINAAVLLSIVTLIGGGLLYLMRDRVLAADKLGRTLSRYGPEWIYGHSLNALNTTARGQTVILQNGYLRFYLLTIIGTAAILVWTALRNGLSPEVSLAELDVYSYELGLTATLLLAALVAVGSRSRLGSIAGLGVVGYTVAAIFVLFGAPDLAMTQFVVETLTVTLLVLVFYHLPDFKALSSRYARYRDAVVALSIGGTITVLLLFAANLRSHQPISEYFVQHSAPEAHGRNIVNVILVDFRALDTLGEITVLAISGIGVYGLLKLRLTGRGARVPRRGQEAVNQSCNRDAEPAHDDSVSVQIADASVTQTREEIDRWIP